MSLQCPKLCTENLLPVQRYLKLVSKEPNYLRAEYSKHVGLNKCEQ